MLLVAFGVLLGIRLDRVHAEGWEWRLWPSAAPPKISYQDRDHSRATASQLTSG